MDYENMTYMTTKEIDQEIAELRVKINELEAEKKKLESSPAQHIAIILHTSQCRYNHTDQCSWYYFQNDWTESTHVAYLEKAKNVMAMLDRWNIQDKPKFLIEFLNIKK